MKNDTLTRVFVVAAALTILAVEPLARPPAQRLQLPERPYAPKSYAECDALDRQWDLVRQQVDRQHSACLKAAEKGHCQRDPATGCDCKECAPYHNSSSLGRSDVQECRDTVRKYLDEQRRQEEERRRQEEERRRQEEERRRLEEEARRKAEEQKRDADRRQKDADQKRRDQAEKARQDAASSRKKEADSRQAKQKAEQDRMKTLQDIHQKEQEMLERRTEMREQQKEGLKKEEERSRQRLDDEIANRAPNKDAVENQIAQLKQNDYGARPPGADSAANKPGSEFDLGALRNDSAQPPGVRNVDYTAEYQHYQDKYDVAPADPIWRAGFDKAGESIEKVKEYVQDRAKELVNDEIRSLPDRFLEHVDGWDKLNPPDPLRNAVSATVNDLLKEPGAENRAPSIGGWIKDKVANMLTDMATNQIKTQLAEKLGSNQPADPVERSYEDLWNSAKTYNLGRGLKKYMEDIQEKFSRFFGLATDRLFGDGDDSREKR
jgi:chemotaxis protein histidine kinase CheA